jgi:glycosyltransferase involved in cell wall biosynthesis
MHAVFVLPRFYPYRGGYENSMLSIARCLVARGHRATVFTTTAQDLEALWLPGFRTFSAGESIVDGVAIRRFPVSYNKLALRAKRVLGLVPYWRWKAQFWRPGFLVPGLRDALHSIDADIFHIGPLPYNNLIYAGVEAAEHRRVPVIGTPCTHLGQESNTDVARHYVQPYQVRLLQCCDRVLCMTEAEKAKLALSVRPEKLAVLPLGFDLKLSSGGTRERILAEYGITPPIVLHMGMKAYEKGSVTLVEAMKELWDAGWKAPLVMAGPSLREFDEYLAENTDSKDPLVNIPAFPDELKRDLLAAADVVVQPSRVESLGLVLMEAWANAKPVIAADIAVSRELIESCNGGTLVPFGDVTALAEKIGCLLADVELQRDLGRCGQTFAQAYDGEKVWPMYAREFERIAARDSRGNLQLQKSTGE